MRPCLNTSLAPTSLKKDLEDTEMRPTFFILLFLKIHYIYLVCMCSWVFTGCDTSLGSCFSPYISVEPRDSTWVTQAWQQAPLHHEPLVSLVLLLKFIVLYLNLVILYVWAFYLHIYLCITCMPGAYRGQMKMCFRDQTFTCLLIHGLPTLLF